MMTYWAVVGLSHALDFYRESQERASPRRMLGTRLAEARLQALQRQLHPHFLFNTLHTISALMHRDIEAADAMLARLSDLLRLSLDRIGTQQVRSRRRWISSRSTWRSSAPGSATGSRCASTSSPRRSTPSVPNLLLQPLVENAIRHGIAQKVGGGLLEIRATRESGELCLLVRDNGPGTAGRHVDTR